MNFLDIEFPEISHRDVYHALDILIPVAKSDTGQSRICADFLLAWWNGHTLGRFDIVEVASVDWKLGMAMAVIVLHLAQYGTWYPKAFEKEFFEIIDRWRDL